MFWGDVVGGGGGGGQGGGGGGGGGWSWVFEGPGVTAPLLLPVIVVRRGLVVMGIS